MNWALRNGETTHGVTLHDIAPGIDGISQVTFSIYPDVDEVEDVYARALEHGWTLLRTTPPMPDAIQPTPQDESLATTCTRRDDAALGDRAAIRRSAT